MTAFLQIPVVGLLALWLLLTLMTVIFMLVAVVHAQWIYLLWLLLDAALVIFSFVAAKLIAYHARLYNATTIVRAIQLKQRTEQGLFGDVPPGYTGLAWFTADGIVDESGRFFGWVKFCRWQISAQENGVSTVSFWEPTQLSGKMRLYERLSGMLTILAVCIGILMATWGAIHVGLRFDVLALIAFALSIVALSFSTVIGSSHVRRESLPDRMRSFPFISLTICSDEDHLERIDILLKKKIDEHTDMVG